MDYKFLIKARQDQAGDENAKLTIAISGTTVLDQGVISSSDSSSPTEITFEATGLASPSAGTNVNMVCTLSNDYYVDTDTDRNVIIQEIWYTDKADNTNYKLWNKTTGRWDTISSFTSENMMPATMTAVSGDDQDAAIANYSAGDYVTCWSSSSATVTVNIPRSSGEADGYPASSENPK